MVIDRIVLGGIIMKNYVITVNGTSYEVSVEEVGESTAAAPAPAPVQKAAPKAPAAPKPAGVQGGIKVTSPMPGKILSLKSEVGASVKRGDVLMVLEAMKMENEIVAPQDGTVASINVAAGDSVEAGALLATLK